MELGGWRTRRVFNRYNVTSERDLAVALVRASRYVAGRSDEPRTVRPAPRRIRTKPARSDAQHGG
jgi:hypothetical protein